MTMLRVFEATARHLSFTRAADELFLTQSALSKQVKALEDHLGRTLFIRLNRGLVLTPVGQTFLNDITPLLCGLEAATKRIIEQGEFSRLTLRVLATLGERWLLERFPRFAEKHPDIEVSFTAMLSSDGSQQSEIDGDFRFGTGSWPGLHADYLFGNEMILVASPSLIKKQGAPKNPEDISHYRLLTHFQSPHVWTELAEAFPSLKLILSTTPPSQSSTYEFYNVLIRAAVNGLGLALVPHVWVLKELEEHELINPLSIRMTSRFGYYFVVDNHKTNISAMKHFRNWLIQEAKITRSILR